MAGPEDLRLHPGRIQRDLSQSERRSFGSEVAIVQKVKTRNKTDSQVEGIASKAEVFRNTQHLAGNQEAGKVCDLKENRKSERGESEACS